MQYPMIKCPCGKDARIVECGVGVYIRCPYCEKSTPMGCSREKVEKEWRTLPEPMKE